MDNNFKKIIIGIFLFGILAFLIGCGTETGILIFCGLVEIVIGIIFIVSFIKARQLNKEDEIKEQKERMKYKNIMPSDYLFPIEKFYRTCISGGWKSTKNDIHVRKMMLIAKNLIKEDKIDLPTVYDTYANREQVIKFFELMHQQELDSQVKNQRELEQKKSVPQEVTINSSENEFKCFNEKCMNYKYSEKRREYLKYLIYTTEQKRKIANEKYKSAKKTSESTYYATQGKDWAIAGGIANAIAGPAAGAIVASETIKENEKNQQSNQLIRNYAWSKESEAFGELLKVEETLKKYKKELDSLDSKIIFEEVSSIKLSEHLKFDAEMSGSFGKINLTIKNNYQANPELATVIDGTVQVKVYSGEILLDNVCIAFPCNGVACGKSAKAYSYIKRVMISDNPSYRFEITPNFLWLMEK